MDSLYHSPATPPTLHFWKFPSSDYSFVCKNYCLSYFSSVMISIRFIMKRSFGKLVNQSFFFLLLLEHALTVQQEEAVLCMLIFLL